MMMTEGAAKNLEEVAKLRNKITNYTSCMHKFMFLDVGLRCSINFLLRFYPCHM